MSLSAPTVHPVQPPTMPPGLKSMIQHYWQVGVWAVLLAMVNWPLLHNGPRTDLLFFPQAVTDGQWWRAVTYPLVHLSGYHLLLDGGAFLLLYHSMEEKNPAYRMALIVGAGIGSLALALAFEEAIAYRGLCGLSGIAHGLMAACALEMIENVRHRFFGLVSLLTVVSKSAWELWTGRAIFAYLHFGDHGVPLVACHAGGVLGAMLVFGMFHHIRQ
jgi:rhomboid family GlyGly-CTERM serine protease